MLALARDLLLDQARVAVVAADEVEVGVDQPVDPRAQVTAGVLGGALEHLGVGLVVTRQDPLEELDLAQDEWRDEYLREQRRKEKVAVKK